METSYKEKYEQALSKAKDMLNYKEVRREDMEYLFPELAESEDEKIRNGLVRLLKELLELGGVSEDEWDRNECEKYIAWLEKQGEKHPDPYNGISFEYNDHIWGMCARDNGVDISCDKHLIKHLEKQGEKKPSYTFIAETGDGGINALVTKELPIEMKSAEESLGVDSDTYNKIVDECIFGEKKPAAWSEEDERIRQCLIEDQEEALDKVRNDKYGHSEIISDLKEMYRERIDWLKSLKQRIGGKL